MKYINISNLKTENVEDMSYMFTGCKVLESIDLSNFITSNVINMRGVFYFCEKLENLDLSTFNTDKVNDMSYMFYGMKSLKILDISNFNMKESIRYNYMFSDISNIRYINIKNLVNDKTISNTFNQRTDSFYFCGSNSIIDNINAYKCCEYDMLSDQCNEVPNYIIIKYDGNMNKISYENGFGINNQIPSRKEIEYIIKGTTKYQSDESLTIEPNDSIEIYFSNNIDSLEHFFSGSVDDNCKYIISVDLSNFNSSLVVNAEGMFENCVMLKEINFTNFDTSSITSMKNMFFNCLELESLN